ncbi:MAG: exodeoxyribonuclease VII large subunit, partial [Anaerolineaceae bacterium]|nr:exodeoxyribonuclease VII large subunit [Anaerolineaceae bacterium]
SLNPASILQRGFALVEHQDGSLLYRTAQTAPGETLNIRLSDGIIRTRVEEIQPTDPPAQSG